jgi:hypothetical protein
MTPMSQDDQFQCWLMEMDDAITRFVEALPKEVGARLDKTPSSLSTLEAYVLSRYESPRAAAEPDQAAFVDGAARYFGEVLRSVTGGRWEIRLRNQKDVYYGLPVLAGGSIGGTPICPLMTVTAATDRRTGSFFSKVVHNLSGEKTAVR